MPAKRENLILGAQIPLIFVIKTFNLFLSVRPTVICDAPFVPPRRARVTGSRFLQKDYLARPILRTLPYLIDTISTTFLLFAIVSPILIYRLVVSDDLSDTAVKRKKVRYIIFQCGFCSILSDKISDLRFVSVDTTDGIEESSACGSKTSQ